MYVHVTCPFGQSSDISFRLICRTASSARRWNRVNSCAMRELLLFIHRKKHTPCHPARQLWLLPACVLAVFSHGHTSRGIPLLSRQREAATPQLHNRRPRRRVHLTSQIHNSLTLCRAKRPAATATNGR